MGRRRCWRCDCLRHHVRRLGRRLRFPPPRQAPNGVSQSVSVSESGPRARSHSSTRRAGRETSAKEGSLSEEGLVLFVLVVAVAAWTAASAVATIHPLVCSENSAARQARLRRRRTRRGSPTRGLRATRILTRITRFRLSPWLRSTRTRQRATQGPSSLRAAKRIRRGPWRSHVTGSCASWTARAGGEFMPTALNRASARPRSCFGP